MSTADEVADLLATWRFTYANENELQAGIAQALTSSREWGWTVTREVRLGAQSERIDLVLEADEMLRKARIGIEVKVAGSVQAVRRQLLRYSKSDRVDELILVTNRASHEQGLRDWVLHGVPHAVPLRVVRTRWI